ncbi:MAG: carbamate kinase [Bacteroidota bacterium]
MLRSALIAIGGNSLIRAGQRGTALEQLTNARETACRIAQLVTDGWRIIITHGNGPQVGAALLRSERASQEVYPQPLDVCVATTQSEIGYLLQRGMLNALRSARICTPVMTILTQVQVSGSDQAFRNPTKPIGPFYSKSVAEERQRSFGWTMVEDAERGYRRVVASPEPVAVLEQEMIRQIMELGIIVIALGGGGIPIVIEEDQTVKGIEAVIDKDRASALLASGLGIDCLIISTDVEQVYLDYKRPKQRGLKRATAGQMQRYLEQGHFPPGSMGPKIESAIRFLQRGGKEVIITSCDHLLDAVQGKAGTQITP